MNVLYHQEGKDPKQFVVLKKNDNGTVDIGLDGGQPVVTFCKITDEAVVGSCTVEKEVSQPEPSPEPEPVSSEPVSESTPSPRRRR